MNRTFLSLGFMLSVASACGGSMISNGETTDAADASSNHDVALIGDASGDGDANDGSAKDATADSLDLTGVYGCGKSACGTGEYCIHPCNGGVLRTCIPYAEGGTCPANTVTGYCMGDAGPITNGCVPPPPPPFCSANPSCPGGPNSGMLKGRDMHCVCA